MKKIFISYSTKNKEIVERFVEFLQLGMGVRGSDIFCTACPENLRTGNNFVEEIRQNLKECELVISVITEEYLASSFCMVEIGAAWGMEKPYVPLLAVPYERLNGTVLQGVQMRQLDCAEDLCVIYDELYGYGILQQRQTAQFHKQLSVFLDEVRKKAWVQENQDQGEKI